MVTVTVKTLDNQSRVFEVPDHYTVGQFKQHIADSVQIPVGTQRLIYLGRVLQNDTKLTDAGVDGKAVHLVERAPPNNSEVEDTIGQSASVNPTRFTDTRRHDQGGGAMYLGAMAIPADLMESQGISMPQPRQGLTPNRIALARSMLRRAQSTLTDLENSNVTLPNIETSAIVNLPVITDNNDGPMPSNETADNATVANEQADSEMQVDDADDAGNEATESGTAEGIYDEGGINVQNVDEGIHVVIGPSIRSFINGSNRNQDTASNGNNGAVTGEQTGSQSGNQSDSSRRRSRAHTRLSAMASVLEFMSRTQRQLFPFLRTVHYLLAQDPVFNQETQITAAQAQVIFNSVSDVMHDLSHAYHHLSDIMCDFLAPPPRSLRCRPVVVQHPTVLHTGLLPTNRINLRDVNGRGRMSFQSNSGQSTGTVNASNENNTATATNSTQQESMNAIPSADNEIPEIVIEDAENNGSLQLPSLVLELQPSIQIDSVEATIVTSSNDPTRPSSVSTTGPIPVGTNLPSNVVRGMIAFVTDHIRRQHNGMQSQTQNDASDNSTDAGVQQNTDNGDSGTPRSEITEPNASSSTSSSMEPRIECIEILDQPEQLGGLQVTFSPSDDVANFETTITTEPATDESGSGGGGDSATVTIQSTPAENNHQTGPLERETESVDAPQSIDELIANYGLQVNESQPIVDDGDRQQSENTGQSDGDSVSRVFHGRRVIPRISIQRQRTARQNQQQSDSQPVSSTSSTSSTSSASSTFTNNGGNALRTVRIRRVPLPAGLDISGYGRTYDLLLPCNSHHIRTSRTASARSSSVRNLRSGTRAGTATASAGDNATTTTNNNSTSRNAAADLSERLPPQQRSHVCTNEATQEQRRRTHRSQQQQSQQQGQRSATASATASNNNAFVDSSSNASSFVRFINQIFNDLGGGAGGNGGAAVPVTAITPGGLPYTIIERVPFTATTNTTADSHAAGVGTPRTGSTVTSSATSTSATQTTQRTACGTQTAESVLRERVRRLETEDRTADAVIRSAVQDIASALAAATVDVLHGNFNETNDSANTDSNTNTSLDTEMEQEQEVADDSESETVDENDESNVDERVSTKFMDCVNSILVRLPFIRIVSLHDTDVRRLCLNFRKLFRQYLNYHYFRDGFERHLATDVINKLFNDHIINWRHILDSPDVRSDIDLVSTICRFNHMNLPDLLRFIMTCESDDAFALQFPRMMRQFLGQFITLIKSCLVNSDENLRKLILLLVDDCVLDLPNDPALLTWLRENLVEHMIAYESLPVSELPLFIKDYIVFRLPDLIDLPDLPEDISSASPMEVGNLDGLHFDEEVVINGNVVDVLENGPTKESNGERTAVTANDDASSTAEQFPNLLIEPEPWHNSVPADWVPIITRDVQKLRRQGSQPPFSDAYLSGMPTKRRKLLSGTTGEVSNSVDRVMTDNTMSDRNASNNGGD